MIKDLNAISTASIPVIKATVDLALLRKNEMKKSESQKSLHSEKSQVSIDHFGETQNIKDSKEIHEMKEESSGSRRDSSDSIDLSPEMAHLKIDITFDDKSSMQTSEAKTHQGLESCKLIKYYVENYKCLKQVAIILKQFLNNMDLNSPYHGKYLFPTLTPIRRSFLLLHSPAVGSLHEQMELEDESDYHSIKTSDGFPGLL